MALTQRRRYPNNAARRTQWGPGSLSQGLGRTPITLSTLTFTSATSVTCVFNQPVTLTGVPQYTVTGSRLPTAASQTNATTIVLTFGAGSAITSMVVPFEEPAVRARSGGFVNAGSYAAIA